MTTISKERAQEVLAEFRNKAIVVVGDVMLDGYVRGDSVRLSPEAPVPVLKKKSFTYELGGAGNVARNVRSLGAKAALVSLIGNDEGGRRVMERVLDQKIWLHVQQLQGWKTTQKDRYLAGAHHIVRVDTEEPLPVGAENALLSQLPEAMQEADGVLVSDYDKGVVRPALVERVRKLARQAHIPILADVKPPQMPLFEGVEAISPNLAEAESYLDKATAPKDPRDIARAVAARWHVEHTFVTAADQGIYVVSGNQVKLVPQRHKVEVNDTSGCGDTAAAVLLLATLCGASNEEAADLANAAGAWVAGKVGAAAPTPEDVLAML